MNRKNQAGWLARKLWLRTERQALDLTKTGKPDTFWHDIMFKYAQGKYHFTTGKKPGAKKWKDVLHSINNCPLHNKTHSHNIFGQSIICKCGYHKCSPNHKRLYFSPHLECGRKEFLAFKPVRRQSRRAGF
ncbi:hypothetical protein KOW79_010637 [Hemibagrus wyckioides]|uniref:Uncharacterized protein n=1 Tax=Hemibagrus wyckioides TaxID=337641 RepID=A0A9D3NRM5_9TELE|nr:hypothetical protein KOW79_010637 [Hemibagrus wyckioides]